MGTLTSAETSLAESKLQRKQESVPKDSLTWGGVLGTSAAQPNTQPPGKPAPLGVGPTLSGALELQSPTLKRLVLCSSWGPGFPLVKF